MGKTGSRELNYVSDVDVVFVGEPVGADGDVDAALASATRLAGDTMRICRAGRLGGRREPAARGQGRRARPHAGQPRRVLPAAGRAPGSSRRCSRPVRSPATPNSAGPTPTRSPRWCGRRPSARTSSPTCRPCAAGSSSTSRPRSRERDIKLGPGGLRDVEFAVQLLQLVHGRGDESLRVPETLPGPGRAARRRLRRPRRRRQPHRRLPLPARHRAPAATAPAAAHPPAARRPGAAPVARAGDGLPARSREAMPGRCSRPSGTCMPARSAGCTRSSSTGRCSRRWPACRPRGCA